MTKHSEEEKKHKTRHGEKAGEAQAEARPEEKADKGEDLQERLAKKEKEAADNYDKYVRAVADLDNFKKHAAKEKTELLKFGNENLIKDILPILDNFDRGLEHAESTQDIGKLVEGLKMIKSQLLGCLEKYGVVAIESIGREFDPNLHEAMTTVETTEHEPNRVVQEFEKGYLLNNRLLKPAKVAVSKRTESEQT
jgi:molecular chaperone GrpE